MWESPAASTLRWVVWSPSSRAATVRKLSAALWPPPGLTIEIGIDHDFVTGFPADNVTDSKPLPIPFSSHCLKTWCGFGPPPSYDSGEVSSVTAA